MAKKREEKGQKEGENRDMMDFRVSILPLLATIFSPSFLTNYRFDDPKENRSASELETRLQKAGSSLLFFIS